MNTRGDILRFLAISVLAVGLSLCSANQSLAQNAANVDPATAPTVPEGTNLMQGAVTSAPLPPIGDAPPLPKFVTPETVTIASPAFDYKDDAGNVHVVKADTYSTADTAQNSAPNSGGTAAGGAAPGAAQTAAGAAEACPAMAAVSPDPETAANNAIKAEADAGTAQKITALTIEAGQVAAAFKTWSGLRKTCGEKSISAQNSCFEGCNTGLQTAISAVGTVANLVGALGSQTNMACSDLGTGLKVLQGAFLAYQGECAVMQGMCNSTCADAITKGTALSNMAGAFNDMCDEDPLTAAACTTAHETMAAAVKAAVASDAATSGTTVGFKNQQCRVDFEQRLGQAAMTLASLAVSMAGAKSCDTATAAATATTLPISGTLDCTLPANMANQTCICQANPRLAGCANSLAKGGASVGQLSAGAAAPVVTPSTPSSINLGDQASTPTPGTPADSSLNASPLYSGSGSGFGSGAQPATDKSDKRDASGKLNSGIFGGDSGGGGGVGSNWNGGSKDDMKEYMPGGAKDPNRGVAGAFAVKDVTGAGGRSNWEKVKDRYKDEKPTLLSGQ